MPFPLMETIVLAVCYFVILAITFLLLGRATMPDVKARIMLLISLLVTLAIQIKELGWNPYVAWGCIWIVSILIFWRITRCALQLALLAGSVAMALFYVFDNYMTATIVQWLQ